MFRWPIDSVVALGLRVAGLIAAAIVVWIVLFLILESWPAWTTIGGWRFLTDGSWHPTPTAEPGQFLLVPMLVGSLASAGGAILLATPLAVASALFCCCYAPEPLATGYRRLLEVLAGVPSVVYGFWGLVTLAPLIRQWQPPGQSLLAGVLILTLMILPTIALVVESSIRTLPRSLWLGAAALGLGRWATIREVILPAVRGGLATGILLGTGRALGETMAVLMVTGNLAETPSSVFDPVRTLSANIALELGYALELHRAALFASGLVLMGLVTGIVLLAELGRREGRS